MIGAPRLEERAAQPYVGIRTQATMRELGTAILQTLGELYAWCGERNIMPAAAPFIRYHVIDMAGVLDIELGVPVATPHPGEGRVAPGVLPAGRYAALVYTGVKNGVAGNKALLDWGAAQGLTWDKWDTGKGDGFGARIESFLTPRKRSPIRRTGKPRSPFGWRTSTRADCPATREPNNATRGAGNCPRLAFICLASLDAQHPEN